MKKQFDKTSKVTKDTFKTGYKVAKYIYYPKIRCYKCKTFVSYNAHRCPKCLTGYNNLEYEKLIKWQKVAVIVSYILAGLLFIAFAVEGNIILGIFLCFITIALIKFVIQKIQSVINYFH